MHSSLTATNIYRAFNAFTLDSYNSAYRDGGNLIGGAESYGGILFNAARVVPTGGDNRPLNTAVIPRQKR